MGNIAAFDIGGTFVKHGVISENGEVFFSKEYKTHAEKGGKWIIENLCAIVCELMKKQEISGVAISTAGVVDPEAGKIVYANENIPGYTGTEIKKIVEEHCGIPCEVENDVACAGLAEAVFGVGRDCKTVVCITVGTGVGGCIIHERKIFHGAGGCAGEIGYMNIFAGNLEKEGSASALVKRVKEKIQDDTIDGCTIFENAKAGNEPCVEEIEYMCDVLGQGIANICCMINPDMVVLGGGVMKQKEYLEEKIKKTVSKWIPESLLKDTALAFAEMENDAGIMGAYENYKMRQAKK